MRGCVDAWVRGWRDTRAGPEPDTPQAATIPPRAIHIMHECGARARIRRSRRQPGGANAQDKKSQRNLQGRATSSTGQRRRPADGATTWVHGRPMPHIRAGSRQWSQQGPGIGDLERETYQASARPGSAHASSGHRDLGGLGRDGSTVHCDRCDRIVKKVSAMGK